MSVKQRNLPLWMVKSDEQNRGKQQKIKQCKYFNKAEKKRAQRVIDYWMNERELVETALAVTKDATTWSRDAVPEKEVVMIIPETDDDDDQSSDEPLQPSVSNISEQQTVSFINSAEENTRAKADRLVKPSHHDPESSQKPDVDDEALELVREIFFT